jgi:hypothetical protein
MAGKNHRDYRIWIHTDDPSMFDRLPDADTGYEALMRGPSVDDFWEKEGEPTRRGSTADATNQGGHIVEEEDPWQVAIDAEKERLKREGSPRIEPF